MSTITTLQATDTPAASRADINTNFSNLNADKIESLSDLSITATATELNYCDGVTSNIQTQLDTKSAYITGEIKMVAFGEGSIPSGWLICDGAAVSRTTYSDLFTSIGTTYGAGNGTTTFNVPDLRGRIPGGKDDMGQGAANRITDSQADTLGGAYGSETHTLTTAEIPAHTHTFDQYDSGTGGNTSVSGFDATSSVSGTTSLGIQSSGGSGGAHNNVQPTLFLHFIIKT